MIVYTTVFGKHDYLREPLVPQSPSLRFVCLTDQPPLRLGRESHSVWEIVPIHDLPCTGDFLWSARYQKLHPPAGESVWIDSSLSLLIDLLATVREINRPMICLPYRKRCCVYEERRSAVGRVRDQSRTEFVAAIERQVAQYREIGLPEKNGLHLTGLTYRDGSAAVQEFTLRWWEEMRRWNSPRDQVALARVEWESGFPIASFPDRSVRQFPHRFGRISAECLRPDGSLSDL